MMLPRSTAWLALLFAASRATAQTTTSCNPTEKTCPENPGLSSRTYTHDFTTSGADNSAWNVTAGSVNYTPSGLAFTVSKSGDAPTLQSKWYILFGRVSFILKSAPGTGIVSSAILESSDLDEIDWEWLGGTSYASQVQTNYFGKGNTTSYDRAAWTAAADAQKTARNYTISWTKDATVWYVDDVAVRTLNYADAVGGKNYPQTPMNVRVGIWAGGDPANDPGTIQWAGGETDYSNGPFTMYLEKIEVVNDNPGSSYSYSDMTGDWTSIKVNSGDGSSSSSSSSGGGSSSGSASASASASGSSSPSSSSTESGSASKPTPTTPGSSTGTHTGISSTASASASESSGTSAARAQAATGHASALSLSFWQYAVLSVLTPSLAMALAVCSWQY